MLRARETGKHLCRQQCVGNNVSSFARAYSHSFIVYFGYFPSRFNQSGCSIIEMIEFRQRRFGVVFQLRNSLGSGGGGGIQQGEKPREKEPQALSGAGIDGARCGCPRWRKSRKRRNKTQVCAVFQ